MIFLWQLKKILDKGSDIPPIGTTKSKDKQEVVCFALFVSLFCSASLISAPGGGWQALPMVEYTGRLRPKGGCFQAGSI